jgi:hypothetical protein
LRAIEINGGGVAANTHVPLGLVAALDLNADDRLLRARLDRVEGAASSRVETVPTFVSQPAHLARDGKRFIDIGDVGLSSTIWSRVAPNCL